VNKKSVQTTKQHHYNVLVMKLAWSGFIVANNPVFIFYIRVNYFRRTFTENCKIIHEELGPVKSFGG